MGAVITRVEGAASKFDDKELEGKDDRRRNSLAFYISQFVPYEDEDYKKLIDAVKADKNSKTGGKPPVVRASSKFEDFSLVL